MDFLVVYGSASHRSSSRSARWASRRDWRSPSTDGPPASLASVRQLPRLYAGTWAGLPFPIVIGIVAYAVFHVLMYHTRYGAYVFAIGGNRESLMLAGVRANAYHVSIYALAGAVVGAAGLLFTGA